MGYEYDSAGESVAFCPPSNNKIFFNIKAGFKTDIVDENSAHSTFDVGDKVSISSGNVSIQGVYEGYTTVGGHDYPVFLATYDFLGLKVSAYGAAGVAANGWEHFTAADFPACYLAGTMIATSEGDIRVEELRIGDLVVTASGAHRPVKWIGTRAYSARFVRNNPHLRPICFQAGSLGQNLPLRDLRVSQKHAMFVGGFLVEAGLLANGATIAPDAADHDVRYFHVELETHDLLIAEGAFAESFVDDESRAVFQNANTFDEVYPGQKTRPAVFCAPHLKKCDPRLDELRRTLAPSATAQRISMAA